MRHTSGWWAVGLVAAAAVTGCGPEKELPDITPPKPVVPTGPPPDPNGPAPAASDIDAKEVLDRAVKAVTGGAPDRLAKVGVSRVVCDGKFRQGGRGMVDAERRIEAVWSDRGRMVYELDGLRVTFRFRDAQGWMTEGLVTHNLDPADVGRMLRADIHAQHWVFLGPTLADPKAVAFGRRSAPGGTAVKVALSDMPVFLVTFADATGLPVRVEYHPVERGQRVQKEFEARRHAPFDGFTLPAETRMSQNGLPVEEWTTKAWEFPKEFDPALFDRPKD